MKITDKVLYSFIEDELKRVNSLDYDDISEIATNIVEKINSKRYTLAPTYLTDSMYVSQKEFDHTLEYEQLNNMYKSAINNVYTEIKQPRLSEFDDGYFW